MGASKPYTLKFHASAKIQMFDRVMIFTVDFWP